MLEEIKTQLLQHPEYIKELLEKFGYCNIVIRDKYIQFGRDEFSSKKSIVIRLDNKWLWVTDYARNINKDIFGYIINQRNAAFIDILNEVKNILHIDSFDYFEKPTGIFGGFYNRVHKSSSFKARTYDNSILDQYEPIPNLRFLNDNISIEAQRYFNIKFDVLSQTIIIPIYNQFGELIGVKGRCNYDVIDGEQKYYYHVPCAMSQTLYGYSHNYNYLYNNTIYVFESEKSVMQCYSYGMRNCVALGSGSLSKKQAQMIYELHPIKVVFMHDVGYNEEYIFRNINMLQTYSRFYDMAIGYWKPQYKKYPDKASPSDMGKNVLKQIIEHEIQMIEGDNGGNTI